ncbi:50S ribosomal protein L25 [candidate division KSB1 bacterium]
MSESELKAQLRKETGKQFANTLRREGKTPGVFYIHGSETLPLTFEAKELESIIASKPALISLNLDDGTVKEAIVREIQRDPISSSIRHIDFMGITRGVKITVTVPVKLVGEPVGVKGGGIIEHLTRELQIECLPKNIPEVIEVDISELDIGDSLHVSDLSLEDISILTLEEVSLVNVMLPKVLVEPTEVEEEEEEEVEGEVEGEAAEGEKTESGEETQEKSSE